jgi:hypothetical protein
MSSLTAISGERSEVIIQHTIKVTENRIINQLEVTTLNGDPFFVNQLVSAFCTNHHLPCGLGRTVIVHNPTENSESQLTKFLSQNDIHVIIPPMEVSA